MTEKKAGLVTEQQAAEYLALADRTLRNDRSTGALGIPFIKLGESRQASVRYALADLDAWIAARRVAR